MLKNNDALLEFYLNSNQIGEEGVTEMVKSLITLPTLKLVLLDLRDNLLPICHEGDEGMDPFQFSLLEPPSPSGPETVYSLVKEFLPHVVFL
jgi:hypothetical protein